MEWTFSKWFVMKKWSSQLATICGACFFLCDCWAWHSYSWVIFLLHFSINCRHNFILFSFFFNWIAGKVLNTELIVLPLPSESWQEMCGNVFCHGDANFAADTLAPKVDDCFISKMDYVLHSSVLKNNKVKYGSNVDYEILQGLYSTYCPSNYL